MAYVPEYHVVPKELQHEKIRSIVEDLGSSRGFRALSHVGGVGGFTLAIQGIATKNWPLVIGGAGIGVSSALRAPYQSDRVVSLIRQL